MLIEFYVLLAVATPATSASSPRLPDAGALCDSLAGHAADPGRPPGVTPLVYEDIVPEKAMAACAEAVRLHPEQPRYRYQWGRSLGRAKQWPAAFLQYSKAAEQGYPMAMVAVGRSYEEGEGVERNYARAMDSYRRAAASGMGAAEAWIGWLHARKNTLFEDYEESARHLQKAFDSGFKFVGAELGMDYLYGSGVKRDPVKAREYLRAAAAVDDRGKAMAALGFMLEKGLGGPRDLDAARQWYAKAAAYKNLDGMANLGTLEFFQSRNKVEAAKGWEDLHKAADAGSPAAMFQLAYAYDQGKGVASDVQQARVWYEKAGAAGDNGSWTNLGYLYDQRRLHAGDNEEDGKKAFELYLRAAEEGDMVAMSNVGFFYRDGYYDGTRNFPKAEFWFTKAAMAGSPNAMYALGDLFDDDEAGMRDDIVAVDWYRRGAENGDIKSIISLGWSYENGIGVGKDAERAIAWYKEAAERGNSLGMNNLGGMYFNSESGVGNTLEAFKWYARAVQTDGLPLAHFNVALCFRDGSGVDRDPIKAAQHMIAALEGGEQEALKSLREKADTWSPATWSRLQAALKRRGYFNGRIDGKPELSTMNALKALYKDSGGTL